MSRRTRLMMLGSGRSYHATRWANALVDAGLDVSLVTIHRKERPLHDEVDLVEMPSIGRPSYLLNASRVRALARKIRPDLVHSHSAGGYAILGRLVGLRPWIISAYGSDVFEVPTRSRFHRAYLGYLLREADELLSTSQAMADHVRRLYPSLPEPTVTPFGVDTGLFSPGRTTRQAGDVVKVGIVKKLERKYGIDVLIGAFTLLAERHDLVELHIVGEGTEKERLLRLRESSGHRQRIFFHPAIPNVEVPRFLRSLDIFVVPSRSESFGVAAVEASAVGLPVVVSDVGGLPEVVEHERTGLVVKSEDPRALAEALGQLIRDPERRARLGAAGRTRVEREYDWSANVATMLRVYQRVLENKKKS